MTAKGECELHQQLKYWEKKSLQFKKYVHIRKSSKYIWNQRSPEAEGAERILPPILDLLFWVELCAIPVETPSPQDLRMFLYWGMGIPQGLLK